ncbi:DUF3159 domain-containing protein [Nocardioides albidus]|uniref:DUF3159 domain-containing protein n=1 Tax=Nocardioides albidus TaxID=1517589 RepID=A0A5C4W5C5_9ACTN|nr:DUF3159 domain-containing protein [Nocardioides albidus]
MARPAADRRHRPGTRARGERTGRDAGRRSHALQPPIRAAVSSPESTTIGVDTVEALVRRQLAGAIGGRRGAIEAALPGVVFTAIWLPTKQTGPALVAAGAVAVIALVLRLVQRSSTQYVFNAIFGLAVSWVFVRWAQSSGGDASDQALAYFLPGILYSGAYTIVLAASCLSGWPMLGFMLGVGTEDPLEWRHNKQVVRLCSRLTWVMMAPGAVGVALQGPIWLLGHHDVIRPELAVTIIAVLRLGLGWALRIAAFSLMFWLLARNATPLEAVAGEPAVDD